jgi:hypothetical protein
MMLKKNELEYVIVMPAAYMFLFIELAVVHVDS